ncbi:sensor histidine kinase [Marinicrinis lubricantis]|uniref:histidine kinase n=1 Tax=Marinicrinis lubricantis TaxID=2086470 RepID=A0ABW1IK61_9BACL
MNLNPLSGLRGKMLLLFIISLVLSMLTTLFLLTLAMAATYFHFSPVESLLESLYYNFGMVPVLLVTGAFLFCFYVIVLSSRYVKYLMQITSAVQEMSKGRLDIRIPIKTKDELGRLADHINGMAWHLKSSMEEERGAVQAKNELITNVSHDLRTPLTSVVGYLELIHSDGYRDEIELRHYVQIAFEKSKRLERLVNDLFEYTRVSYGKLQLRRDRLNLVELLGQLAAEYSFSLQQSEMEMVLNFNEDHLIVSGDGDQLMRVFENLISNGINYGKEGKKIVLTAYRSSNQAIVQVANYGPPIPIQDLPHIFDRFYRVEKSRSTATGGTGLGLAISKSIIELHDGTIEVRSSVQETCFEVKLPLAPPHVT